MTIFIESIVDTDATSEEAHALAKAVVADLCDRGIILPTPQSHEFLENGSQYATGPNALDAADVINDCFPCGLNVCVGRNIYDTGELGFDLFCPSCKRHFDTDAIDWAAPVGQWYKSGDVHPIACPECAAYIRFTEWFRPAFGFGNLAFCFSEWLLKREFVDHVSGLLRNRVTWVKAQY